MDSMFHIFFAVVPHILMLMSNFNGFNAQIKFLIIKKGIYTTTAIFINTQSRSKSGPVLAT